MGQGAAIICRQLVKSYRNDNEVTPALQGINLEVQRGELMMLVGPSGCGKTTLISVIAGILDHDSGDCIVLDQDLKSLSDRQRTNFRGIHLGFVFQSFNLIPTLTARENVAVPLMIQGMAFHEAVARADEVLATVGLQGREHSLPTHLSGGQQQRVAIARALVHKPSIIVCDEPTSALDKATGHQVMELLRTATHNSGRTLVIVTHDARIFEFADRIATMNDGKLEGIEKGRAAGV